MNSTIDIQNIEGLEYLSHIEDKSIDLILTDPPYIISKETGMNKHYNEVKENEENSIQYVKTEEEWEAYKAQHNILTNEKRLNFLKYGTIYGKKYCVNLRSINLIKGSLK